MPEHLCAARRQSFGRDDEALAAEFAALVDVIDVAADGQPAVGPRLDEAGDQRLGARRRATWRRSGR